MRSRSAGLALLVLAPLALTARPPLASAAWHPAHPHPRPKIDVPDQPVYSLDGVGIAVTNMGRWYAWATAKLHAEAEARARRATSARSRPTSSGSASVQVSGSCEAMRPAGFPSSIVMRESGGNPTASNPSGAYGCAQILRSHFNAGGTCAGLDYASCWSKMYREQGLRPWACTPQSGCG